MQHLATIIREQLDPLVDRYDARLRGMPGYSSLPEAMRRELERHFLNLIVESLEAGDYNLLVQYAQQRASQWDARGLNLVWFQQALSVPEELLVPLIQSVETSNFVWEALNRSQGVVWQMIAERTHQTEERFRAIVETAHSGIMIVDDQFHFTYVNEQLTYISGYSQAELIGADFRQLLDEDSRKIVADRYVRRQRGVDLPGDYEIVFIRKDGQKRCAEMSVVLLQEANGGQQTVAQVLDITERKQAEAALAQERNLLHTLIDSLPDQIFFKDTEGRVILNNMADARAMGVTSPAEAVGKNVFDLYPAELAEQYHADDMVVIHSGQPLYNREEPSIDAAGEPRWVLTTKVPLTDNQGKPLGLVGIGHDITQRKLAEQRVRELLQMREHQARTSTEVSQEIAAAPDLNELFMRVVTLVKDRFHYYHAQIFRYDPARDAAVLVAGYGEVGQRLLTERHQLPMGHGVVGTAATNGKTILASDVTQDADWRPNPYLPDTKGELAVPIKLREEVLGVLDVQSDQVGALTDEDRLLLEGLCGQIASAIENTRLLEHTETLYNISAQLSIVQAYDEVLTALRQHTLLEQADLNISVNLYDRPWVGNDMPEWTTPVARWSALPAGVVSSRYPLKAFSAAPVLLRADEPTIISDVASDSRMDDASRELYGKRFGAGSTIFLPLVASGKWIGYVNAMFKQPRTFEDEAIRLLTIALEQAGTVIESLRRLNDLSTSEARLAEALRIAQLANWEYDVLTDTFTFNDRLYGLMHTTAEREGGYTMSSAQYAQRFVHPEDAPLVGREVQIAIETTDPNYSREFDHRIFYADGELGYITVRFRIEKDAQGRTVRTFGANQDITDRKQTDLKLQDLLEKVQQSERLMRTLIDVAPDEIYAKDTQGRLLLANAAEAQQRGIASPEMLIGQSDFDFYPRELAEQYFAAEQPVYQEGQSLLSLEEQSLNAEGRLTWHSSNKVPLRNNQGQIIGLVGITRDITERKLAEAALAEERNRLRILIDNLPVSVFIKDRDSRFTVNNAVHLRVLGAESQEEVLGKWDFDFFPQELAAQYYADEQELMRIGQPLFNREEFVVDQSSGKRQWALSTKIPLRDAHGQVTGFLGFTQDITERREAEAELQRSEQLMRTLIDAMPDHIYAKDLDGRLILANLAEARLRGVETPDELVGKSDFDFYPHELAEQYLVSEQPILRDGMPLLNHEEPSLDAAGHSFWSSTTKVPLRNNQGQIIGLVGRTTDITERKLAEAEREQLLTDQQQRTVQLQTAAEVGRIATSILNPDQLLAEIVNLIAVRFGFYHVAVFTLDDSGRWAQLRDATGEVGQQLKDRGQALAIRGQSIVGSAIRERRPRIALDVGADAVQFNDPLLPDTHSEIALPLIAGDQVLGALDLHSTTPAAFDENSAILLQAMADQIAVALNTAEQYEREQAHVEQTNRLMQIVIDLSERTDRVGLQNRLVRSALSLLDTDRAQFWVKSASGLELKAAQSVRPGADQSVAISQELADRVCRSGLPLRLDSPPAQVGYASRITNVPFNAALLVPISWQGQTTGVLSVTRSQPGRPFTQDDENAAQLLAAQAAAALENITLAEQQQHRAVQLQAAAEISQATSSILSLDALLPQAAELVRSRFDLYYVGIFLNDEVERWAVLRAGTGDAGQQLLANRHKLKIGEPSMISQCIVKRQARIALDVGAEAVRFDNPWLPLTRSELALPLISRGRVIGAVTIQSDQSAAFTPDDITGLQTMADQIGNAVENAQLYEQSTAALQEVDALNRRLTGEAWESYLHHQVGQAVISVTDDSQTAPDPLSQLDGPLAVGEVVVEPAEDDQAEATITAPILLRGQTIGALRMRTPLNTWDKNAEAVLTDIAGHVAQAVENARLIEQTQRTASRERAINEINARVRQTIDLDAILRTAVNELGQSLKAARVTARINVADSDRSSRRFTDTGSQPGTADSPRGNDHD